MGCVYGAVGVFFWVIWCYLGVARDVFAVLDPLGQEVSLIGIGLYYAALGTSTRRF